MTPEIRKPVRMKRAEVDRVKRSYEVPAMPVNLSYGEGYHISLSLVVCLIHACLLSASKERKKKKRKRKEKKRDAADQL